MTDTIVKIGLILQDDAGRLLIVRKHGGRTFILPGGKPDADESDMTCLMREVMEELGVHVYGNIDYLGTYGAPAADMEDRMVMVRAYRGQVHGDPTPRSEIAEMHWMDIHDPDVPIADTIRKGIIPAIR